MQLLVCGLSIDLTEFLKGSDYVKRILFASFVIVLTLLTGGCSSRKKINQIFDTYEIETAKTIPYVYYDTLIFGDIVVDFGEILNKNECTGVFREVYVIQDDTIWFGYADVKSNENNSTKWNIASINSKSKEVNVCYSGEFSSQTKTDSSFYYDSKIVLTDDVKIVEYNLQTRKATEYSSKSYEYPTLLIEADIIDYHTISFLDGNKEKIFDVKQGKQSSKVFEKLCQLEKKKDWQGNSYLSELFDNVQIVNNQIFIVCRVLNWDGETHAIVFEYDYDSNSCKYAFHCFMDDVIGNNLKVVPLVL